MKKIDTQCARCGKQLQITLKTVSDEIECTHCHKKQVLSAKSRNLVAFARYMLVAVVCLVLMIVLLPLQKTSPILYFAAIFLIGVLLSSSLEKYCIKIAFILFRLNYIDVDEALALEAEKAKRKAEKKNRKAK